METGWRKSSFSVSQHCVEALPQGAAWRNASNPNGSCVDALPVGLVWQKAQASLNISCVAAAHVHGTEFTGSSESGPGGNCVQAGHKAGGHILVRDSKDPDGPHLHFTEVEWLALLNKIHSGRWQHVFRPQFSLRRRKGHWLTYRLGSPSDQDTLTYYRAEVTAFRKGVRNGEFALLTPAA